MPSRFCAASAAPRSTSPASSGISKATVSRILKRRGLSLLSALEPQPPRPRYERAKPGEIIHLDIKKLGRFNADRTSHHTAIAAGQTNPARRAGPGWEFVHVAIDEQSGSPTARSVQTKSKPAPSPSWKAAVATTKALA